LGSHEPEEVARRLGLHANTVVRWMDLGRVPSHYIHDFARMLGLDLAAEDIGTRAKDSDAKKDKDQYYTKPRVARKCLEMLVAQAKILEVALPDYHYIEPAAGRGTFYDLLPRGRRTGIDIAPRADGIVQADFLDWRPRLRRKYAVVGNPPFGLRGHLALQFINHASEFADIVAFILPQLFESDGKGVPGKRVKDYKLAMSRKLPSDSFAYPDGRPISIHTVFQVWTKVNTDKIRLPKRHTCHSYVQVRSVTDGGTPSSTRNKHLIGRCDLYLPSTCFSGMRAYEDYYDIPSRRGGYGVVILRNRREIKRLLMNHDWGRTAFSSTNSALNLRRSLIEDVVVKGGFRDGQ